MPQKIIIPLPHQDFDPTEAAVPWKLMKEAGFEVLFATEDGNRGYADPVMITGEGLDPWGWIPGLKKLPLLGLLLRANNTARAAYSVMETDSNFLNPMKYSDLRVSDFDGVVLPGGHAPGMKPYLESKILQTFIADCFDSVDEKGNHKPVAAICHGVLLAARSISSITQKSVLYNKKTTALPWQMEKSAWDITKFYGRFWDSNYYRTYQEDANESPGYRSVELEIKRFLEVDSNFITVEKNSQHYFAKNSGLFRDQSTNSKPALIVQDGNYISARWPGDAYTFAKAIIELMDSQ